MEIIFGIMLALVALSGVDELGRKLGIWGG